VSALGTNGCGVGVAYGYESTLYSFPNGHPLNSRRTEEFGRSLSELAAKQNSPVSIVAPVISPEKDLELFHTKEYIDFVKHWSKSGTGYLDYGDTPSFKGVYEAALFTVGNSLNGLRMITDRKIDHFFNPVGGLHHARKDRAGGFCVFNDCSIAISKAINELGLKKVAYVDIDAHHGDGVYYGFEDDRRVIIADIHEDGRFLYPGTGSAVETGKGEAEGTKLNIPLPPGAGDDLFIEAFDKVMKFLESSPKPEFVFLQCGADGLEGDPLTHLKYSKAAHSYAARKLHEFAHKVCDGEILAMGGGGYNTVNVRDAWLAAVNELSKCTKIS
jgi:acetoin utilization protein AcuC